MACLQPPFLPQDPNSQRQEVTLSLSGCWLELRLPWVNLNRSISALHAKISGHRSPTP